MTPPPVPPSAEPPDPPRDLPQARPPAPGGERWRPAAGATLVLDGGLSNQLADQGCDLSDQLWTARLLADDPGQIRAAHTAYARAGADVLITSGYQAGYEGFARRGIGRAEASALLRSSVTLARQAAAERPGIAVAASVGPYGAVLADGSEYRGRYGRTVRELTGFHRPRIEAVAEAAPDVLALETVPDIDEAEAMLRAAAPTGLPVWLSYTVEGGRTRAGQPLAEAFALAAGRDEVVAVGVNCCAPQDVLAAVELAVAVTGKPAVAYPNSGEQWDAAARRWAGPHTFTAESALAWQAAGARLIGGCCRVGPAAIEDLRGRLDRGPG
ncbi:homocysteine S-methyltransferase [Streptomyces sp. NRRL F-5123]|uniref:homocysteine S-methyltransferase n=1 Tax=Streptomyces sp. NRRL F-5123 TaxID=1463856 RepID=UPI00099C1690|nr:homocysteine S-methyltransferase [Streptomyces sp. NRRL F-5123]